MSHSKSYLHLSAKRLQEITIDLLHAGGFTLSESQNTAQSLVLSNLMGHDSHGIVRIAEYLHDLKQGTITSGSSLSILNETDNSCQADGNAALGQGLMPAFLDILLGKAKTQACVTGAIKNCGHIGRLGEWSEKVAQAGYAAMVAVNDNGVYQVVAPPGGKKACTSTNPVAFGIPLPNGEVFSLDMSTSAVAAGKMRLMHLAGQECASGLVQDKEGIPSTNPAVLFEDPIGALLPMGGEQSYKGFGLSMIVDFLAAGLSGGFTPPAPNNSPLLNNVFVSIWNPEYFAGLEHMGAQAQKYMDYIRSIPATDDSNPIRLPGDRSSSVQNHRIKNGIPISHSLCGRLAKSAEITGIKTPEEVLSFLEK